MYKFVGTGMKYSPISSKLPLDVQGYREQLDHLMNEHQRKVCTKGAEKTALVKE